MSNREGRPASGGDTGHEKKPDQTKRRSLESLQSSQTPRDTGTANVVRGRDITHRIKEQTLRAAVNGKIEEALSLVFQQFEWPRHRENRLTFHGIQHTQGDIFRTEAILIAIQRANPGTDLVTEKDIALGKLAAAFHDIVQKWEIRSEVDAQGNEVKKRIRASGENEKASADLAESYMRSLNKSTGNMFSERDIQVVREAILITIAKYDKTSGRITQPDFAKYQDNLVAQALALADLGGSGMEGFPTARWATVAHFIEDYPDVAAYAQLYSQSQGDERKMKRDIQKEQQFHKMFTAWLESEVRFNQGRQEQVQREIASMDPGVQEPVKNLFARYDEVITGLQAFTNEIKTMDFPAWMHVLLKEMYKGPNQGPPQS